MEFAAGLRASLRSLRASGTMGDPREQRARNLVCRERCAAEKPVLHLWPENCTRIRRHQAPGIWRGTDTFQGENFKRHHHQRLLRYLSREIEVTRVGLAASWRTGLRVVRCQQSTCKLACNRLARLLPSAEFAVESSPSVLLFWGRAREFFGERPASRGHFSD
jgi:hypothetical protein